MIANVSCSSGAYATWLLKACLCGELTLYKVGTVPVSSPSIQGKWTVHQSCDGSSVSGTDLWTGPAVAYGASPTPHAWVVLESPSNLGPLYFCIDMNNASSGRASFALSRTAPTGGTTTDRPTAADEISWLSDDDGKLGNDLSSSVRAFFGMNELGEFYFFTSYNDLGTFYFRCVIKGLVGTKQYDAFPVIAIVTNLALTKNAISPGTTSIAKTRTQNNLANRSVSISFLGNSSATSASSLYLMDKVSLEWASYQPLWFVNNVNSYSIRGSWTDVRWCPESIDDTGDGAVFPSVSAIDSMSCGNFLFPAYTMPCL